MHWQAAIKTSTLLPSYSGWAPSSGVLFNFGCFSRIALLSSSPTFYLFIPSSHAFSSVSSLLPHLLSPLISPLFFPQPPARRGICFCQTYFVFCPGLFYRTRNQRVKEGGKTDDPKLSANTCWMLQLTRPCALGGGVWTGEKKKKLSTCACLSQHKYIFWGLAQRFVVMLNDCLSRYGGIWLQERKKNHERFL